MILCMPILHCSFFVHVVIKVGKLNSHTRVVILLPLILIIFFFLFGNREGVLVEDMFREKLGGILPVTDRLLESPVFNMSE
jgi:hypothetical protein